MKIWKYNIESEDCVLTVPQGARFLTLQVQNGLPTIWMLLDEANATEQRRYITFVTGSFADIRKEVDTYVGTYQLGWFVGHIFERKML